MAKVLDNALRVHKINNLVDTGGNTLEFFAVASSTFGR
jgi:hypothetical protein